MAGASDLLLYDGVCVVCNWFTRFVLSRDRAARFRFAPLQSDVAEAVLARHGRAAEDIDTVYVIADEGTVRERVLAKSAAALHVLSRLGWPWRATGILRVVPTPILDRLYDVFVRNRYRLFGQYETCPLPGPEGAERFIGFPASRTSGGDDHSPRRATAPPDGSCQATGGGPKPRS
jgi:predicted DCC family thiol-disulfide oxidoreductase YuxK